MQPDLPKPNPETDIDIKINLSGLRNSLLVSLRKTLNIVSALFYSANHITTEKLHLPANVPFTIDEGTKFDQAAIVGEAKEWILINGFRDAIEATSLPLEEAYQVILLWEYFEGSQKIRAPLLELQKHLQKHVKAFHRLGFPDKLERLTQKGLRIDSTLRLYVESINSARNCLVHRHGIVSQSDMSRSQNFLSIKWKYLAIFARNEDGDLPLIIPENGITLEKPSTIVARIMDDERSFSLGEKIKLNPAEFQNICYTLYLFIESIASEMNLLGIQKGMIVEDQISS